MAMRDALFQILTAIHDDRDVRAMVLRGAGQAFSTGGDLAEFGMAPSPIVARWVRFRRDVWGMLRALPIPTIAAIHGYTVGGGLEMALLCDVAIAADDTRLSLPETGAGMIPGVAGTQTAARRLGLGRALDLCLTGRWIDAQDALLVGMVAEVVPLADLDRRALAIARAFARVSRERSAILKRRSGKASTCRFDKDSNSNNGSGGEEARCEHRQLRNDPIIDRARPGNPGLRRSAASPTRISTTRSRACARSSNSSASRMAT